MGMFCYQQNTYETATQWAYEECESEAEDGAANIWKSWRIYTNLFNFSHSNCTTKTKSSQINKIKTSDSPDLQWCEQT